MASTDAIDTVWLLRVAQYLDLQVKPSLSRINCLRIVALPAMAVMKQEEASLCNVILVQSDGKRVLFPDVANANVHSLRSFP